MELAKESRGPDRFVGEVVSVFVVATLAFLVINAVEWLSGLDLWNGDGLEGQGWIVVLVLLLPLKVPVAAYVRAKVRERRLSR